MLGSDGSDFRSKSHAMTDGLPPPIRMAISHAPARARPLWAGLFALDRRFAQIVGLNREPMLAQMRLAWWRETLRAPVVGWPAGEPLLAALSAWGAHARNLAGLTDGWEGMLGEAPLEPAAFAALAGARADAMASLAKAAGEGALASEAAARGYAWALRDIAAHLSDPVEQGRVTALLRTAEAPGGRAARLLRPVAILDAIARGAGFATALRIGLIGR